MSWHEKYKLLVFDEIDSTNSEAIRIAQTSCPQENYVLLAKQQAQGRGRTTKTWYSSRGNLHSTILLYHHIDSQYISQLSFVTAVAVHSTITALASKKINNITLKWPNDVLINNKKVSGILIESIKNYLIIGVGINIIVSPVNVDQEITNLSAEGINILSPEEILEIYITNFEKYFNIWKNQGFNKIKQYWLKRSYKLGEKITINDGNTKVTGAFMGLEIDGAIKLQLPSGEIYIGRA